jgi:hypothetical protein
MTKEQLAQLVTVGDLHSLKTELIDRICTVLKNQSIQEFYSPKEFAAISGLKYSTVVNYCATCKLAATQTTAKGGWLIHRSEVDRLISESMANKIHALPQ